MKTIFRFQSIFLLSIFGIFSCTDNIDRESLISDPEYGTTSQEEVVDARMGATTGDQIPYIVRELENLAGKSVNSASKGMDLNDVVIDFSDIRWIISQNTGRTNYTFPILVKGQGMESFYNLLVMVEPDGTILPPIVREYRVAPHAMTDFKASGYEFSKFKGTQKDYYFTDFFDADFDLDLLASRNPDCPTTTIGSTSDNPELNPDLIVLDQHQNWSGGGGNNYPIGQISYESGSYDGPLHNTGVYINVVVGNNSSQYQETVSTYSAGMVNLGDSSISAPLMTNGVVSVIGWSVTVTYGGTDEQGRPCVTSIEQTLHYSNGYSATATTYSGICLGVLLPDMKGASAAAGSTGDCPNGGDEIIPLVPFQLAEIQEKLCLPEESQAYDFLMNNSTERDELYDFLLDNNVSNGCNDSGPARELALQATIEWASGLSVINFAPLIKYPVNSNYENQYPRLTEYLKNQLPTVANIPKITNAIHEFTQLPLTQIQNDLQWNEGPIVEIIQLDNYKPGETDANTAGYFDKSTPDRVYLDIDYVNLVENETSDPDALLFWIGTTVLHEYVHYGDFSNGFDYEGEEGRLFEIQVYGTNVQPDIARLILNRLNN